MDIFKLFLLCMSGVEGVFKLQGNYDRNLTPVIYAARYPLILDDVPANSAMVCAIMCSQTTNCQSFTFQRTDHILKRCYNTTPGEYLGSASETYNGRRCKIRWDSNHPWAYKMGGSVFPDETMADAKNYCRDPFQNGYLWCLLDEPTQGDDWDSCHVPKCMTNGNCRMYSDSLKVNVYNVSFAMDGMTFYQDKFA